MMTREEKQQLVDDILKRDVLTGASAPLYQDIPPLMPIFSENGVDSLRKTAQRVKDWNFNKIDWEGKTVLDIGCDNGMMMYEAYKRGAKLTVGIEHPRVGDEAERVAKLLGNKSAKFVKIDVKTASLGDIQSVTGMEQFDIVMFLALDSFVGQKLPFLSGITKELLMYEKLLDNVTNLEIMNWLESEGFVETELVGYAKDFGPKYGLIMARK
jgi:hypothetical protein